ncbi:MAG: GNAT family N-acetyltransferase [Acidobacteriota bacterium]|nr:GNAT family N-acetyltransferase [Acidobacteriota bacterium]
MDETVIWFYTHPGGLTGQPESLPEGYRCHIWRPQLTRISPDGFPRFPYWVWWAFHMLGIFRNRSYALCLIYCGEALAHRSVIFPKYFRFPFMTAHDLQIGDTWTDDEQRGKGLASYALRQIVRMETRSGRKLWYVAEEKNTRSIRVAEGAGFRKAGVGVRTKRLGIRLLGSYIVRELLPEPVSEPVTTREQA